MYYTAHCHILFILAHVHVCCLYACVCARTCALIHSICIMYYSKLALEGELKKLRGHYTQVNDERNQLKRTVDEREKEIQELIDSKSKVVQDNSDSMELMRNQLQQYARDYEEEQVASEKFAQQVMKLDKSIKEKDEEIDQLKRKVDEREKEIQELIDSKSKVVQDNSDSMELMRNQLQQYARDYEEERIEREKYAQQMMKLQQSIKEKDEEIDQLKRKVDEREKEIQELIDSKSKVVQDNSDSMELMRNQLQQYARDYEEERIEREKYAQQMMKLQQSIKEKDEEIDQLKRKVDKDM